MAEQEMREVYAELLAEAMERNEKVCTVDADLAKANGTHGLRYRFPGRALDVGIAEQNMACVAAGMTSFGYQPWISTFCCFVGRMADQILLSIGYAGRNVKIVGTDPGILAEINGGTHMGIADVGMMRAIPNMVIVEPADTVQLRSLMPQLLAYEGPAYMRLARRAVPPVYERSAGFDLWRAEVVRHGQDVTLIACGMMVYEALRAAELLEMQGISAEVMDAHTIKPLDVQTIMASVNKTSAVVTCENGNILGGLHSAVSEVTAKYGPVPVLPIGIRDRFGEVGRLPYLKQVMGMTAEHIVQAALQAMRQKQSMEERKSRVK